MRFSLFIDFIHSFWPYYVDCPSILKKKIHKNFKLFLFFVAKSCLEKKKWKNYFFSNLSRFVQIFKKCFCVHILWGFSWINFFIWYGMRKSLFWESNTTCLTLKAFNFEWDWTTFFQKVACFPSLSSDHFSFSCVSVYYQVGEMTDIIKNSYYIEIHLILLGHNRRMEHNFHHCWNCIHSSSIIFCCFWLWRNPALEWTTDKNW